MLKWLYFWFVSLGFKALDVQRSLQQLVVSDELGGQVQQLMALMSEMPPKLDVFGFLTMGKALIPSVLNQNLDLN